GAGSLHAETAKSGSVTISGSDSSSNNFNLTADSSRVPTSTSQTLAANSGGTLDDSGSTGVSFTAGSGVLETGSGNVTLSVERNFTAPDSASVQALANASFDIGATGASTIKNLNGNAGLQINYTDLLGQLPSGVSESDLQLASYSPERGDYVPVEGGFTVDATNNIISGQVDHLTSFVLVYAPPASSQQQSQSGGGGGTPPRLPTPPTLPTPVATNAQQTVRRTYDFAAPTAVTVGGAAHTVTVSAGATDVEATVTVQSNPITVTLKKDEVKDLDTNADGILDLRVTYHGLIGGKPEFEFVNLTDVGEMNNAVTINAGAYETSTRTVRLGLRATNARDMLISNVENFAGATAVAYATSTNWTVTDGNGLKTVYVKFRSSDSGESMASDTIRLVGQVAEQAPPVVEVRPLPILEEVAPPQVVVKPLLAFKRILRSGLKGDDVIKLQARLRELGYFKHPKDTGLYGVVTRDAVIKFQRAMKLKATGMVDKATIDKLNVEPGRSAEAPKAPPALLKPMVIRVLKMGLRGDDVRDLQARLRKLGHFKHPKDTGLYGAVTRDAVKSFQKEMNLTQDGTLNAETRTALSAF
ncbi:MAG: peptidoglycan-binding protein, partial [Candidatus Magasanikbacteria bacterium]|nr:peptidoglycan-binding protein [Candidatus Magasanikbacteria bacterium]